MWAPIFNNGQGSAIYFLIESPDFSAWHRIPEQEMWIHVAGSPMHLYTMITGERGEGSQASLTVLDSRGSQFQAIVPANQWMAARPASDWSLVVCTLTPAFTGMELATRQEVESWNLDPSLQEVVRGLIHG
jgi:predicted cupin superfamily sugar epimerase